MTSLDDDRRDAEEGSSSSRSLGRDISARPIATICCWPPESWPAGCRAFSSQHGKQRVAAFDALGDGAAPAANVGAHLQIFAHRHFRKQPPAFGHERDAVLDIVGGVAAADVAAAIEDACRRPGG